MVSFEKIVLKNILSFEDVEFDFNAVDSCVVLGENRDSEISDSNGSGKSSLFSDAIVYAIYGKSDREMRKFDANKEDSSYVELHFEFNSKHYIIRRYANDYINKNKVIVFEDGEDLFFGTIKEAQSFINKIFNISYDNFVSSIIFKQGFSVKLSAMTPTQKKQYFSSLVSFNFDEILNKVKEDIKILSSECDEYMKMFLNKKMELKKLEGKIDVLNNDLSIDDIKKELEDVQIKYDETLIEINDINKELSELEDSRMKEFMKFNERKSNLKHELDRLKKLNKGVCPICGNKVDVKDVFSKIILISKELNKEFVFEYDDKIKELKDRLDKLKRQERKLSNELYKLNSELTRLIANKEEIQNLKEEYNSLKEECDDLSFEYETRKEELDKLKLLQKNLSPSGEFRTIVLKYYLNIFNSILKNITTMLFPELKTIEFVETKDGKGIDIKGVKYNSLSGGEKRRFDFLVQLAFSDFISAINSFDCNIRVLDETFDTLDKSSILHILKYINDVFYGKKIICITHNNDLKTFFGDVVVVRKENGKSTLDIRSCKWSL